MLRRANKIPCKGKLRRTQTACTPWKVASVSIPFVRRQATLESGWQENRLKTRRCLCSVCLPLDATLRQAGNVAASQMVPRGLKRPRNEATRQLRQHPMGAGRCGKHRCTSSPNAGGTEVHIRSLPRKGVSAATAFTRPRYAAALKAELRASLSAPMSRMGRPLRHCLHLMPEVQTIDMKTLWSAVTERPHTNFHSDDPLGSI